MSTSISYKDAGVDIAAGDASVSKIAALAKSTFSKHVLRNIGHFGAFFELDLTKYKNPVLVSSVDGVGTKLKIAFLSGIHNTVGECLVNHCVNDIMTSGADPLYFMDYIALGKLEGNVLEQVIEGLARGCKNNGCALIGGETAEMPDFYHPGEYDISGTIVGAIEKNHIVAGDSIEAGDKLIGLPSNGLHTNGYSLVRKIFFDVHKYHVNDAVAGLELSLGEELLRVHKSYKTAIEVMREQPFLNGMSHITGGGLIGNTRRILPEKFDLKIDWSSWEWPAIFRVIRQLGNVQEDEMRRVFNLGIGYVFVVSADAVDATLTGLTKINEQPIVIGEVIERE
ncbi:phosphoribosylformylglycinamidine cyclo-ligase [candidate division KSB1 bacterium]|nr:phosphoribosylformylglycinamidine cyclo-ligase [candidate division KSB1 bacterium]